MDFEETNQNTEINETTVEDTFDDGSNMFDGALEEKTHSEEAEGNTEIAENSSTEQETLTPENTESAQASAQPDKTILMYNGNNVALTLDELKTNAQKGLNYDHVKDERDKFQAGYNILEQYAEMYGVSVDDYISSLSGELSDAQARKYAEENNVSENGAKTILELQKKLAKYENSEKQADRKEDTRTEFHNFLSSNPSVDPSKLPQEFFTNYINEGMSFEMAFAKIENKQLKEQLAALQKNEENKQKAVGSAKSEANNVSTDAFLEGLNS